MAIKRCISAAILIVVTALSLFACARPKSTIQPESDSVNLPGNPIHDTTGSAQLAISTSEGLVVFSEKGTDELVRVYVQAADNDEPIVDAQVIFLDGEGYEFFYVLDPSEDYLPNLALYEHNSEHIIKLERNLDGSQYQVVLESFLGNEWVTKRWIDDQGVIEDEVYQKTMSAEEFDDLGTAARDLGIELSIEIILDYLGSISLPTAKLVFIDPTRPRVDHYHKTWDFGSGTWKGFNFYVRSNDPQVQIQAIEVDGDTVTVTWEGYDAPSYEDGTEDPTRFLGLTEESDLRYRIRLVDIDNRESVVGWQDALGTSWNKNGLSKGNYEFQIVVYDERNLTRIAQDGLRGFEFRHAKPVSEVYGGDLYLESPIFDALSFTVGEDDSSDSRVPDGTYLENSEYGYELYYSNAFSEISSPYIPLMIVDPIEGLELVSQEYFSGTNLKHVHVGIGASSNSSAISSCMDYGEDEIINSIPFKKDEFGEGAAGSVYWQINYRTLQKGICYELGFVIAYGNMDMYTAGSVEEFDKNGLFQEIDQLMSTFSILE